MDGLTHDWEETIENDKQKQTDLENLGYTVLRFQDKEIMENIFSVSEIIQHWIKTNHADKLRDGRFYAKDSSPDKKN